MYVSLPNTLLMVSKPRKYWGDLLLHDGPWNGFSDESCILLSNQTALSLGYLWYLIAMNPLVQDKLRTEIHAALPSLDSRIMADVLNQKMPYLKVRLQRSVSLTSFARRIQGWSFENAESWLWYGTSLTTTRERPEKIIWLYNCFFLEPFLVQVPSLFLIFKNVPADDKIRNSYHDSSLESKTFNANLAALPGLYCIFF